MVVFPFNSYSLFSLPFFLPFPFLFFPPTFSYPSNFFSFITFPLLFFSFHIFFLLSLIPSIFFFPSSFFSSGTLSHKRMDFGWKFPVQFLLCFFFGLLLYLTCIKCQIGKNKCLFTLFSAIVFFFCIIMYFLFHKVPSGLILPFSVQLLLI